MENTKPRLGVLALMLEGYEPLFPGITRRQTDYVSRLLERLSGAASFTFPGPVEGRRARKSATRWAGAM